MPDPRSTGSNNPGATNVYRVGTPAAAAVTLLGDVGKGVLPVLLARQLQFPESMAAYCGFCAFLGHLYPAFFNFQGGKGVATALGVLAALHWPSMVMAAGIWLAVGIVTHISSLASITSFFFAPWVVLFPKPELFYPMAILSAILILRHKENMVLLLKGNERSLKHNRNNQD